MPARSRGPAKNAPQDDLAAAAAEGAPIALCALDAAGLVRWVNGAAAALWQERATELRGRDIHELLPHDDGSTGCRLLNHGELTVTVGTAAPVPVRCRSAATEAGAVLSLSTLSVDTAHTPELRAEMHRARNMLGALLLNAGILADGERDSEQRQRARARMKRNVDELAELLEALPELVRAS